MEKGLAVSVTLRVRPSDLWFSTPVWLSQSVSLPERLALSVSLFSLSVSAFHQRTSLQGC